MELVALFKQIIIKENCFWSFFIVRTTRACLEQKPMMGIADMELSVKFDLIDVSYEIPFMVPHPLRKRRRSK